MTAYDWPGNVRELENRIKRAVVMAERRQLDAADLELAPRRRTPRTSISDPPGSERNMTSSGKRCCEATIPFLKQHDF